MYYIVKPEVPDRIFSPSIVGGAICLNLLVGLKRHVVECGYYSEEMKKLYVEHHLSRAGKPIPSPDCIPTKLCLNPESRRKASGITKEYLGHFFEAATGGLFVSSAFAEVLRQHNFGSNNHLTPIQVFSADGNTLIETGENYYHLWIGEAKDTLLDMASAGAIAKNGPSAKNWSVISNVDNALALDARALVGPELWIETQSYILTFFMSEKLYTALKKAKLLGGLRSSSSRARVLKLPTAD